jgi:hypothetical protein
VNRWRTTAFGGPQQAMCLTAEAANANKTARLCLAAVIRRQRVVTILGQPSKIQKRRLAPLRKGASHLSERALKPGLERRQ